MTEQSDLSGQVARPRVATHDDRDRVVDILVGAFHDDPTWSWAFPDPAARPEQYRQFWGLFVDGALRYPDVWLTADRSAAAVWIPPGGTDMSEEQEAMVEPLVTELLGQRGAAPVLELFEAFDRAHPRDEPHYYLTLLGTHPEQQGRGRGLGLLASTLAVVDQAGLPAYLEASNIANVALYERHGFGVHGSFPLPDGTGEVVTMWRPAHGRD